MMQRFLLSELCKPLQAESLHGDAGFTRVSTDTRSVAQGDLFVALVGERFDAHDFAQQAVDAGAVGLVVNRALNISIPQLIVADTRIALGRIAEYNRTFFNGTLFAVTGSSGKTTVKEMLASVLAGAGSVLATKGNLNNDIGVPLTLLEIAPTHNYAVIEMGASGPNEIRYSVGLAHPDIAMVNNAMEAHLSGFGSLQGVVEAKGEIYDGLSPIGTAVVNLDDPHAQHWIKRVGDKTLLTFGVDNTDADVQALQLRMQKNGCYAFCIKYEDKFEEVRLNVLGRHNVANALAAASLALADGLSLSTIASGLERFTPVKGRMFTLKGLSGSHIIDDSYNANPGSMMAAIRALNELQGERVLVLGDMAELGEDAQSIHHEIGQFAAEQNIERLFAVGPLSLNAVEGYRQSHGLMAEHFDDQQALVAALKPLLHADMTLLIKGSRSAAMDRVVSVLKEGE